MRRRADFDCIVVGGGMVGLAVAALIAREERLRDWRVALLEPEPPRRLREEETDLRVSALSRASERILTAVGAWPAIALRAGAYVEMVVWDAAGTADGSDALRFSAAETGEPDLGHIAENARIQLALLDSPALGRVTRLQTRLKALDCEAERPVLVLEDGRELSCELLVGADGGGSRTRELAGIGRAGWDYGQSAVVAHLVAERSHRDTAWQRFLPTGPVALLPLFDGRVSLVWTTTPAEAAELLEVSAERFNDRVTEATDRVLGSLELRGSRAAFPLAVRHARQYVRPGLALAGDAAHTIHPLAGQGVNLGFLDAACLVEVLAGAAEAGEEWSSLRVLRRYERWRRSENSLALGLTDGINRMFGSRSLAIAALRRTGLSLVGAQSATRRLLVQRALGLRGDLPAIATNAAGETGQ
jgi:2-octaprenylphenol hydroxylase